MENEVSQFQIGSELTYEVRTSTIFLFQITATTTPRHVYASKYIDEYSVGRGLDFLPP